MTTSLLSRSPFPRLLALRRQARATRAAVAALMLAGLLAACGGSGADPRPSPAPASKARAQALAPRGAANTQTLLTWAEQAYPQHFPGHQPDQQLDDITYRHYAATGNYVGLQRGHVLVLGPVSGGSLADLGPIEAFDCLVSPLSCAAERPLQARQNRVVAGAGHTLVVNAQGAGLGWGDGLDGLSAVDLPGTPARAIAGMNQLAGLSAGVGFTLATTRDGRLLVLHHGARYPLELSQDFDPSQAMPIAGLSDVVDAASCAQDGRVLTFVLHTDGRVSSFSVDSLGLRSSPSTVAITAPIRAFGQHMPESAPENCGLRALAADGKAWSLAERLDSRGARRGASAKQDVATALPLHDIACTGIGSTDHCLAITMGGALLSWGSNAAGQLGVDSARTASSASALTLAGLPAIRRVWVRAGASYALAHDGSLYAWGAHLGPDTSPPSYQARNQLASVGPIADLAVADHLVLLLRDGSLRTWGRNTSAQLGRSDRAVATVPVQPAGVWVGTPEDVGMPPVAHMSALSTTVVLMGTTIELTDNASRDADGDALTWQWSVVSKPQSSTAAFDAPTALSTRFTADKPGTYTLQLVVRDGRFESQPAQVTLQVDNVSTGGSGGPGTSLPPVNAAEQAILQSRTCIACHTVDKKLLGPSFVDIAKRYRASPSPTADLVAQLSTSIRQGSVGRWGPIPMPPTAAITDDELTTLVNWLLLRQAP